MFHTGCNKMRCFTSSTSRCNTYPPTTLGATLNVPTGEPLHGLRAALHLMCGPVRHFTSRADRRDAARPAWPGTQLRLTRGPAHSFTSRPITWPCAWLHILAHSFASPCGPVHSFASRTARRTALRPGVMLVHHTGRRYALASGWTWCDVCTPCGATLCVTTHTVHRDAGPARGIFMDPVEPTIGVYYPVECSIRFCSF